MMVLAAATGQPISELRQLDWDELVTFDAAAREVVNGGGGKR